MDEKLMGDAIKGLVAAGPLALVLFLILYKLWGAYQKLHEDYTGFMREIVKEDGHGPGSRPQ